MNSIVTDLYSPVYVTHKEIHGSTTNKVTKNRFGISGEMGTQMSNMRSLILDDAWHITLSARN